MSGPCASRVGPNGRRELNDAVFGRREAQSQFLTRIAIIQQMVQHSRVGRFDVNLNGGVLARVERANEAKNSIRWPS